ncbi:hypothetical protein PFICI_06353 [Pestalotiopsis fici W106-1]|uniref:Phytanoyl-CoA dioxygenase n=1 Tax=Pestalotiopsis fici (strain W106-1 / CGMCC3.15140) TaxID=1229662 RepID=W3X848_PESFW|nr:uncharacterized protein PFICI_06353 [Pestalotiopsis fici W106-1]ETS81351.1 hypothetical protein PFICI_06353 [Pestalotiopsis fici W106-1]
MALTKTTKANGATRFIPGSHLWDYTTPPPENNDSCVYIELSPGDAFFMLHSTLHGGSANTTKDEYRFICMSTSTTGLLRQEENQYLANDVEKIKKLPLSLQRFLGWGISDPWKGYVELKDPVLLLNPDEKDLANTEY